MLSTYVFLDLEKLDGGKAETTLYQPDHMEDFMAVAFSSIWGLHHYDIWAELKENLGVELDRDRPDHKQEN